jgi:hypothetical protein
VKWRDYSGLHGFALTVITSVLIRQGERFDNRRKEQPDNKKQNEMWSHLPGKWILFSSLQKEPHLLIP